MQTTEVGQLVTRVHCRVQAALLRHVAPPLTIQRGDPVAVPLQVATIGLQDTEQDAQQRGLTRPVGSEQTDEDAGFDIDGDAVQGCPVPESTLTDPNGPGQRRKALFRKRLERSSARSSRNVTCG